MIEQSRFGSDRLMGSYIEDSHKKSSEKVINI